MIEDILKPLQSRNILGLNKVSTGKFDHVLLYNEKIPIGQNIVRTSLDDYTVFSKKKKKRYLFLNSQLGISWFNGLTATGITFSLILS